MGAVRIIPAGEDLIRTVLGELPGGKSDYSDHLVVFPGKRPAHLLRRMLSERIGSAFMPPRVLSIDVFIAYVAQERLGVRERVLDSLDASAILYDIHQRAEAKVGGEGYEELDAFLPVALKMYRELEEIALAGLPSARVKDVLSAIEFPKFRSLASYYEEFYKEVSARGYRTRAMLYNQVAEHLAEVDLISWKRIILAGFYAFTHVEMRIVNNLRQRENVTLIFQYAPGLKEKLKELSVDADLKEAETSVRNLPALSFYRAPDTHGQVFALAGALQELSASGKGLDHGTVIVLPAPETLMSLREFALPIVGEGRYNIALGYPLARTPAYGFVESLMELVTSEFEGAFSVEQYLDFVLHPYTKNIRYGRRSDVTRILFHTLEEYLAERGGRTYVSLEELEDDAALLESIVRALEGAPDPPGAEAVRAHLKTIHDNTIRRFLSFRSVGDFALRTRGLLRYLFDESTARAHPLFRPFVEQFVDALQRASVSLIAEKKFRTLEGYFNFLRGYLAGESVAFPGTPLSGLQVLGRLETRNLKFERVYFLDLNEDVLPGSPAPDLLLPDSVRSRLGLETRREREALIEYYFDLLVAGAREVHLFYSENPRDGKKERSRFVEKLLWRKQKAEPDDRPAAERVSPDAYERTVKYRVSLKNPVPGPVLKTAEIVEHLAKRNYFSSTQLDNYLSCQLRFYYRTVLGLREKAEASRELEPAAIGSFVHGVLKEYFAGATGRPLTGADLAPERLPEVLERCFRARYGSRILGPVRLLRDQVQLQISNFLEHYQRPLLERQEIEILELEMDLGTRAKGVHFTGRIDRVERRGGRIHILDYKTSRDDTRVRIRSDKLSPGERESWGEAIGSFQLPLYMLLYSASTKEPLENLVPAYIFLGRNSIDESIEVPMAGEGESPLELYRRIEEVILGLIGEITDISQLFRPPPDLKKTCPDCPYRGICGTEWV